MSALPSMSPELSAIIARERAAGLSDMGEYVLRTHWESWHGKRRKHLLTALRNGAWLEGREFCKLHRSAANGDPAIFVFENLAERRRHYVRVSAFHIPETGQQILIAVCDDGSTGDVCPSYCTLQRTTCRHCEYACRFVERYVRQIEQEEYEQAIAGNQFAVSAPKPSAGSVYSALAVPGDPCTPEQREALARLDPSLATCSLATCEVGVVRAEAPVERGFGDRFEEMRDRDFAD